MAAEINVVVGEPGYLAREGLVRALEAAEGITVISICSSVRTLRAAAELERPDVVVTGLRFSRQRPSEAVDLVEELQRSNEKLGVVFVGEREDFGLALPLFDRGTERCGFILRERISHSGELTRVIREIAGGNSVVDPASIGTLLTAARRRTSGRFDALTAREREVLALVARADSNGAIARKLGITTRAVERHVNSIFRKLELNGSGDVNRRVKAALEFASSANGGTPARRRPPVRSSR